MIDKAKAVELARTYVSKLSVGGRTDVVLREDRTIERPFGWVFFYESGKYLETGDEHFAALGNSPLFVDRRDGSLHVAGTARRIIYYIERYEAENP